MFQLSYSRTAVKAMARLPVDVARRVHRTMADIAANPYGSHPRSAKLAARNGYRVRIGGWRVLYEIQDERLVVLVVDVGRRGQVYR